MNSKLDAILKPLEMILIDSTTLEQFKTFFKYLASATSAGRAPIRQQMLHEILSRIAKAGEPENIERWSPWTPDHLGLLELADRLSRVILIGGDCTGKTAILDAFATKTAKEHPEENVIFAINQSDPSSRLLLQLDFEAKYERQKLPNVAVVSFEKLSELKDLNLTNQTLCIDEVSLADVKPEELLDIKAKSLRIVIRDTTQEEQNPEEYLRSKFPDWEIVTLIYPLRTSKRIAEKIKSAASDNYFNKSLKITSNMIRGPEPLILPRSLGSYYERLQQGFSALGIDGHILIVLDYVSMQPTPEEIQAARATTTHQELAEKTDTQSENYFVAIEAVKACQRPHGPPLLWFESGKAYCSDTKDDIKMWMRGRNRNITTRDLLTDDACVLGYEADIVILLGSSNSSLFLSLCRGQFVHIK